MIITNGLVFSFYFEEKASAFEWYLVNLRGGGKHFYSLNVYFSFMLIQSHAKLHKKASKRSCKRIQL